MAEEIQTTDEAMEGKGAPFSLAMPIALSAAVPLSVRCSTIDLLVLDVDGVLTDGSIIYTDNDLELKRFHVRDGSGLKLWSMAGKKSVLISGRKSKAVQVRADELGVSAVVQGAGDKRRAYQEMLEKNRLRPEQVCCVGDDLPDLVLLRNCGLAVAVADACPEVRAAAHYVTQRPGGHGAVREAIELVLQCQGHWQRVLDQVLGGA